MSPSVLRTRLRLELTALSLRSRPNFCTMGPTWTLFFAKTSLTPQLSGAPTGDLILTRWPFCAPSANLLRANATSLRPEVVFHRLHSSITLEIWPTDCTPGSRPAGRRLLLWRIWTWMPSPCWGSAVAPGFPLLLPRPFSCLLALPFLPLGSRSLVRTLLRALAKAAHGGLPSWRPRG